MDSAQVVHARASAGLRLAAEAREEVVVRERLHLQEGWSALFLLLLALLTMARAFEASGLAEGLAILAGIVVLGTLAGLASAKAHLPGFLTHALGLLAGIVLCFLLLGTLIELPPVLQADGWLSAELARAEILFTRLQMWLGAATSGVSSSDPLPFVAQMAAVSWLISFYGAWAVFHSHWVWGAVLPAGLATFLCVYYAPPGLLVYFVAFLLWSLLLIVRANIYRQEREWERHRATYEPYIGLDFLRDGTVIALVVVGLVWLLPHPKPMIQVADVASALEEPWQAVQDEWARLYASLSYRGQTTTGTFARALTLGGALNLGQSEVLEVRAPEQRYWRAVVLDRYTGSGWADTSPARLRVDEGGILAEPGVYQARAVMTQTVTCLRPAEPLLFAAGQPSRVLLRVDVQALITPSGGREVSCISPAQSLGRNRRYVVESLVSAASVSKLRRAERMYPAWIAERYLQIPDSLPKRVRDLAREVAGNEATAYDQATAIEGYLRQIHYNLNIEAPPAGVDPVDWFLFDYREGYCTYHASAMVLMCRALGLPARLAQGYAPGEYVDARGVYVVREGDAHAWPEVFFPGYGWVEFEPTPSQPLLTRPLDVAESPGDWAGPASGSANRRQNEEELDKLPDELLPGSMNPVRRRPLIERLPWARMALVTLVSTALFAAAWRYGRRWHAMHPAERLYARLTWVAGPLGVHADPCQTPREFGATLDEALAAGRPMAGEIVELYLVERFAGRYPARRELLAGHHTWRRLLLLALRRSLGRLLHGQRPPAQPTPHA